MHAFSPRQPLTLWRTSLGVALCLTAGAAGIVQGAEIYKSVDSQGHVVYSDQVDPSTPQSVVQTADSQPALPPRTLHFCWTNCFTLVLNEGVYARVDGTDETWTIDHFTANSVLLHRHDAIADSHGSTTDVVYQGDVSNDRLINVTINGKPVSGVDAAWGSALDTLPANNAERDHPAVSANQGAMSNQAAVSTNQAPPPLPDEEQPTNSQEGTLWTPGYWSWHGQRYDWVRGSWMLPPKLGLLWTPAYWGFTGGYYVFHPGYWAQQVGYYGGINYGFGYNGSGFVGGRWVGNSFQYNSAVSHVNTGIIHNTYEEAVIDHDHAGGTRASYTAGPGASPGAPATHFAQAPVQRPIAQPTARAVTAPMSAASQPAVAVASRPSTPRVAEIHDAATHSADGQSQRGAVNSPATVQAVSKQSVTAKSLPKSITPQHP
jgi:hypothetical protein